MQIATIRPIHRCERFADTHTHVVTTEYGDFAVKSPDDFVAAYDIASLDRPDGYIHPSYDGNRFRINFCRCCRYVYTVADYSLMAI